MWVNTEWVNRERDRVSQHRERQSESTPRETEWVNTERDRVSQHIERQSESTQRETEWVNTERDSESTDVLFTAHVLAQHVRSQSTTNYIYIHLPSADTDSWLACPHTARGESCQQARKCSCWRLEVRCQPCPQCCLCFHYLESKSYHSNSDPDGNE